MDYYYQDTRTQLPEERPLEELVQIARDGVARLRPGTAYNFMFDERVLRGPFKVDVVTSDNP